MLPPGGRSRGLPRSGLRCRSCWARRRPPASSATMAAWSSGSDRLTRDGTLRRASSSRSSRMVLRITCSRTVMASCWTACQRGSLRATMPSMVSRERRTSSMAARSLIFCSGVLNGSARTLLMKADNRAQALELLAGDAGIGGGVDGGDGAGGGFARLVGEHLALVADVARGEDILRGYLPGLQASWGRRGQAAGRRRRGRIRRR